MKITKHIPNFITSLNILSGCFAILSVFLDNQQQALLFILLAAVFDFLDGLSARIFKAYSPIGKELDSLADMISFGLAPGFMLWRYLETLFCACGQEETFLGYYGWIAFVIPIFSAFRLAKFNIDTRQTENFLGLATPANALFWAGYVNLPINLSFVWTFAITAILLLTMCFLMVSEVQMFSLKFKNLSFKENSTRYCFLLGAIVLIIVLCQFALPFIILFYILLSIGKKHATKFI